MLFGIFVLLYLYYKVYIHWVDIIVDVSILCRLVVVLIGLMLYKKQISISLSIADFVHSVSTLNIIFVDCCCDCGCYFSKIRNEPSGGRIVIDSASRLLFQNHRRYYWFSECCTELWCWIARGTELGSIIIYSCLIYMDL